MLFPEAVIFCKILKLFYRRKCYNLIESFEDASNSSGKFKGRLCTIESCLVNDIHAQWHTKWTAGQTYRCHSLFRAPPLCTYVTVLSSGGRFYQCTDGTVRGAGYVRALRTAEAIIAVRNNYEGQLESKERFAIQRYLLMIGKKKNMQVL